jgi:MFS transporter, DHA1 family, inner membrane transport protein
VTIGAGLGTLFTVWAGFGLTLAGLLLFAVTIPRTPQLATA